MRDFILIDKIYNVLRIRSYYEAKVGFIPRGLSLSQMEGKQFSSFYKGIKTFVLTWEDGAAPGF